MSEISSLTDYLRKADSGFLEDTKFMFCELCVLWGRYLENRNNEEKYKIQLQNINNAYILYKKKELKQ